jgi:hypothetical protein
MTKKLGIFLSISLMALSAVMFTNCDPATLEQEAIGGGKLVGGDQIVCTQEYRMSSLKIKVSKAEIDPNIERLSEQRIRIFHDGKVREYDTCAEENIASHHRYDFPLFELKKEGEDLVFVNTVDFIGMSEETHKNLSLEFFTRESCDDEEVLVLKIDEAPIRWNRPNKVCHQYVNNAYVEI